MIVIAVEEAPLLFAVHGIVGGIKVEDELFRSSLKRGNELIHHDRMQVLRRLALSAVLKATKGGGACQGLIALHGCLQEQIDAQPLMIVQILIA
jgi:hypothetical protein